MEIFILSALAGFIIFGIIQYFKKSESYVYISNNPEFIKTKEKIEQLLETATTYTDIKLIHDHQELLFTMLKTKGEGNIISTLTTKIKIKQTELRNK